MHRSWLITANTSVPGRSTSHKTKTKELIRSHLKVAVGKLRPRQKSRRTVRSSNRQLRGLANRVLGEETS
jgi:hypothetical protein